ncbi:TlpA disulfide reductase family protein [Sphingobacterium sp.]|uniref:TlpA family protein disulfide reductase n=1 Tax=Sphingobacterium sp. TaxID=341027 RepID=UPI00258F663F|nr:TlpA disulfide reductase family protein [Sphingobacterium sp.]WET67965.1 MAG: TlpA disulfide reductase family protein [Sphingobacterium sp.]
MIKRSKSYTALLDKVVLIMLFALFSMFSLSAQTPRKDSGANGLTALNPGEPIPDAVWKIPLELNYFDGKKKTVKLADFKDKVIVLDFWSTGCKACIEGIPKMELIQDRFKKDMVILMVNSKRNKDTPQRIKTRFQKYREDFNYVPKLGSILNDTVFTTLFEHNTLPTTAVINSKGEFVATTNANNLTDGNIEAWLKGAKGNIKNKGVYSNAGGEGRGGGGSLFDTTGTYYYSAFAKQRDNFLDDYPNTDYRDGTTYLRIGNHTLSFMLTYAFPLEMKDYSVRNAYYAPGLGIDFKLKLIKERYWYEYFNRDSVTKKEIRDVYRKDFVHFFKIAVERRKDTVECYKVSYTSAFEKLKTKHSMIISKESSPDEESYAQKIPIYSILSGLSYAFEVPIEIDQSEMTRVDITIPAGFIYRTEKEKLDFFKEKGIILTRTKAFKEFPYIYLTK